MNPPSAIVSRLVEQLKHEINWIYSNLVSDLHEQQQALLSNIAQYSNVSSRKKLALNVNNMLNIPITKTQLEFSKTVYSLIFHKLYSSIMDQLSSAIAIPSSPSSKVTKVMSPTISSQKLLIFENIKIRIWNNNGWKLIGKGNLFVNIDNNYIQFFDRKKSEESLIFQPCFVFSFHHSYKNTYTHTNSIQSIIRCFGSIANSKGI